MKNYCLTCLIVLLNLPITSNAADPARWYNDNQVTQGKDVFAKNCAECHGKNAESTPDWAKADAQGNRPPPPLNGTAHAWHHPMKLLRQTIRKGGLPVGGTMPAFEGKLSASEIDAIIAWFQAKWPDDLYQAWHKRSTETGSKSVKRKTSKTNPLTRQLRKRLPGVEIGEPEETTVKGLSQTKIGSDYAYLFDKGRYVLIGELIDLKTGENLTELAKGKDNLELLKSFPEKDMVVFPAAGKTQQTITIFTDSDCPFCRKLHKEVPELQKAGIKVRYIPFPRGGKLGKGYENMQSIWCAKNRLTAMNIAKGTKPGSLKKADCAAASIIDRGYELGIKIGLRGTPAIILQNGHMLNGYVPVKELIKLSRSNTNN